MAERNGKKRLATNFMELATASKYLGVNGSWNKTLV